MLEAVLKKRLQGNQGWFELNLEFALGAGETLTLMGPSGCGKSTALRILAGLSEADSARVVLNGRTLTDTGQSLQLPPHTRKIGFLFQDLALFPHLTARQNIAYGSKDETLVESLLEKTGLRGLQGRFPAQLSGGQQQRIALARALAFSPDLLLLDEPFSALDSPTRKRLRSEVRELLQESRIPVILVTHDEEDAQDMGGKILLVSPFEDS